MRSTRVGHGQRRRGFGDEWIDVQDAQHPAGADVGARRGDDVLDGRAQRRREERGVAEERDELTGL